MKKRSRRVKRSSAKKLSSKRHVHHVLMLPFSLRRIVLVTTCVALFVVAYIFVNNPGRQAVAGLQVTRGLFAEASVTMPQVENAVSYNIYFREAKDTNYKNAVREIPPTVTEYKISYLSKDSEYVFKVSAVDTVGAEFWWSAEQPLANLQPM